MPIVHLTKATIEGLTSDNPTGTEYRDDTIAGFGVRVFPSGKKTFFVQYRSGSGRRRMLRLGGYHEGVDVGEVRKKAGRAKHEAEGGGDPALRREAKLQTVGDLMATYLELYSKPNHKARWHRHVQHLVDTAFASLAPIPIDELRRGDLILAIERAGAAGGAHHIHQVKRVLSGVFSWAFDRELIATNPAVKLPPREAPPSRDRVLSDSEVLAIWKACDEEASVPALSVLMVLFTAQRGGEVRRMRRGDVDEGWWRISETKAGREQWAYLGPLGLELLERLPARSEYFFPGRRGSKTPHLGDALHRMTRRLREASGVDDWRIHDLRRTAISHMAALGVREEVLRRVANHSSGDRSALQVYQRYSYRDEVKAAVETWHRHLVALRDGEQGRVLHFP